MTRFFVVIPDADDPERLDDSIQSVVAQGRDLPVTCIVNDVGSGIVVDEVISRWMATLDSRSDPRGSPEIRLVRYTFSGRGEAINRALQDLPYDRDAIVTVVPSGGQLAAGALSCVEQIFREHHSIDLLRGEVARFAHGTSAIAEAEDCHTWLAVGANYDEITDPEALLGQVFCRATAWRRLGGMDADLNMAFMLDFWSKAAAAFRIGKVNTPLCLPPSLPAAAAPSDTFELMKVMRRAQRRQDRLLRSIILAEERGAPGTGAPQWALQFSCDPASGRFVVDELRPVVDRLGVAIVLSSERAPVEILDGGSTPALRLHGLAARLAVTTARARYGIYLRLRTPRLIGALSVAVNGRHVYRADFRAVEHKAHEVAVQADFAFGRNELVLTTDVAGQVIEGIEVTSV